MTYVIADAAGVTESPVYAILKMNKALGKLDTRKFGGDGAVVVHVGALVAGLGPGVRKAQSLKANLHVEVARDRHAALRAGYDLVYVYAAHGLTGMSQAAQMPDSPAPTACSPSRSRWARRSLPASRPRTSARGAASTRSR